MTQRINLFVVDPDFRRRAAIAHCLVGSEVHAEPFEDLDELARRWPRDGLILVYDEGVLVRRTIDLMTEVGEWLPVVAYSESPGTTRVVQAILNGDARLASEVDFLLLNDADALSFLSLGSSAYVDYFGVAQTRRKVAYTLARLGPHAKKKLDTIRLRPDVERLLHEVAA